MHDPVALARPASWYVDPVTREPRINFHWPEHNLAVLLSAPDGVSEDVRRADLERDALLTARGVQVLRFDYDDIEQNPDLMVSRVAEFVPMGTG